MTPYKVVCALNEYVQAFFTLSQYKEVIVFSVKHIAYVFFSAESGVPSSCSTAFGKSQLS